MFYYNIEFDYRKSNVNSFDDLFFIENELSNKKQKQISIPTKAQSKFTELYPYDKIIINTCSLFQFFFLYSNFKLCEI